MAERDGRVPQINDPQLVADLMRILRIRGPLGVLNVLDAVVPVVLMGNVRPFEFEVLQPAFAPGNIFSFQGTGIAVNTVIVDTGQLPAGTYDVIFEINVVNIGSPAGFMRLQHRNAANSADLAVWAAGFRGTNATQLQVSIALVIANNERLRWITDVASAPTGQIAAHIALVAR